MTYSVEEKVTMIKWYYGGNSYQTVSDMFSVEYPNRPIPSPSTVRKVLSKFEEKGTVLNNCHCKENELEEVRAGHRDNDTDLNVLLHVEENKGISTRMLGESVGVDQSTAWRI